MREPNKVTRDLVAGCSYEGQVSWYQGWRIMGLHGGETLGERVGCGCAGHMGAGP